MKSKKNFLKLDVEDLKDKIKSNTKVIGQEQAIEQNMNSNLDSMLLSPSNEIDKQQGKKGANGMLSKQFNKIKTMIQDYQDEKQRDAN